MVAAKIMTRDSGRTSIPKDGASVSMRRLFASFRWEILGTWLLVFLEAALMLMFPLVMGIAIDGVLQQAYLGLYLLGGLGAAAVVVGSLRRFYDTRVYSKIYTVAGSQIVEQERNRNADVSVITARTNMARELVEFFESSFPGIIDCAVGFVGALVMIWFLQTNVFVGCLIATGMVVALYAVTSTTTYALNEGANHEAEQQVQVLSHALLPDVSAHLTRLMRWNIRLSDLETVNFALSWIVMIVLLVYSVASTAQGGVTNHGEVVAILMYVFGYIESVLAAPMFYQQYVRLQEISDRLAGSRCSSS